ncbi:MAG: hypothetical protein WDN48_20770 [Pseudolabrys sp.]
MPKILARLLTQVRFVAGALALAIHRRHGGAGVGATTELGPIRRRAPCKSSSF